MSHKFKHYYFISFDYFKKAPNGKINKHSDYEHLYLDRKINSEDIMEEVISHLQVQANSNISIKCVFYGGIANV